MFLRRFEQLVNYTRQFMSKDILITGGSSGIGLALANGYAESECTLFLIARNPDKLEVARAQLKEKSPSCNVHVFQADVSQENEIKEAFNKINELTNKIDILICNAGVLGCGRFESKIPEDSHKNFEINYWGMHYTTYTFLPLVKSAKGQIVFVSSVAGYTGLFGYSHYAPSKFAIAGLGECIRMEFKDYGVNVSVVYPPDTETPFLEYERENTLPECRALSKGASSITAVKAAKVIIKGIGRNRIEIYFNFESKLIRILKGIAPRIYYRIVDNIITTSRKKN